MKIGISTGSFFPREKTENTFKLMKELKIDLCEVFLTTFYEYKPEFGKLLKSLTDGVEVYSVHTLNMQFEPDLYNTAERTRTDSEFFFTQAARVAKDLGAKYYTFHGPTRLKKKPYVFDYERLGKRTDEIDKLLETEGGGCRLTYENVHYSYFSCPEFFENLRRFSTVGTCLDIKQAKQSGISVEDYLKAMRGRLKNVHLCDYDENGKTAIPGNGCADFTELFKRLMDYGYDGALLMEVYSGDYENYGQLAKAYDYLNECLEKAKRSTR